MPRVELRALPLGVAQDRRGNVEAHVPFTISGGTLFAASSGGTVQTDLRSNRDGELPGWLDDGEYTLGIGGKEIAFQVGAGAGGLRADIQEAMDAESTPDFFEPYQTVYITTLNGLNSRTDDIDTDGGNTGGGGGATFFPPDHVHIDHHTRGSAHGRTATGKIWEAVEGNDIYGELGMFEAAVEIARRGAYAGCFEGATTINSGKQSRAFGQALFISEANAIGTYTMLSAQWNETGARGIWLASTGANPPGTGIFVEGNFKKGLYFQYGDQGNFMLYSKQALATNAFFSINGLGTLAWDTAVGASPITLGNSGAGSILTLTGSLTITNDLAVGDDFTVTGDSIQNGTGFFGGAVNIDDELGVSGNALVQLQLQVDGAIRHTGTQAGFFNTAPVNKPTGVAVTDAGIHAALVTLGLIAA